MANIFKRLGQIGGGTANDKVKISANDGTSDYLINKLTSTPKVILTELGDGANEQLEIDLDESQIDHDLLKNFEADEHVPKDDATTTTNNLWSATKIQTELDGKINAIPNPVSDNKLVKSIGLDGINVEQTGIDVDDNNNVTGINDIIIDGDLTVNGTTTSINTTNLDVEDANITVNKGGTQASADLQNAGITVEMSDATDVEVGYDSTTASKFKIGEVGDTREVVTTTHTQSISNKTIDADNNTVSNIEVDNFKAGVVETDLNNVVDDTKLASAEAIKEYVAQEVGTKDDASEIAYIPNGSQYIDPASTNVQDGMDDLDDKIFDELKQKQRYVDLDPSLPEIAGKRYQTYADAAAYINGVTTPSYYNRWNVNAYGTISTPVALNDWIYLRSEGNSAVFTHSGGVTTIAGDTHSEAYQVFGITFGKFDPVTNTSLTLNDCIVASQETTVGGGSTFAYSSKIFSSAGAVNGPDMSSLLKFDLLEGTSATIGDFNNITLWGAAYLNFKSPTGNSGTLLQAYNGTAQIQTVSGGDLTIDQCYLFGSGIYGNFTDKIIINGGVESQIVDCILYGMNIEVSGAATVLKAQSCIRGYNIETISAVASGTLQMFGDAFNNTGTSLVSNDMHQAIVELDSNVQDVAGDLSTHEGLSAGVHGVTGDVVGTTDTQTLTNKTIDVDNNTVSNIEVDNLKAGVLNTDLSGVATDLQVPSALAVQDYISGEVNTVKGDQAIAESASSVDLTGFLVLGGTYRSFEGIITVEIDATSDIFEQYNVEGIYTAGDWTVNVSSIGDDTLTSVDMNSSGQMQYNSNTYVGFSSGSISYEYRPKTKNI